MQETNTRLEQDLQVSRCECIRVQQQAQQQGELVAAVETECADLRSALAVVRTAVAEQRTFGAAQPRLLCSCHQVQSCFLC